MNLTTILEILNIQKNLTVDEILDQLIIYLRKSRKDSDYFKEESVEKTLQRHEKELQDFIINIFGKPIPEKNIYREVASGDTIEDRPVVQEVLSIVERQDIKAVVCIEVERLARGSSIDQGIIAQTFLYTNTKIITPFKIYNLENDDDLSYFEDGLFQARKYLKYTKKILTRGRVRSVKDGKYVGSVLPYGYTKEKLINEKGFILIENESESRVIRLAASILINGLNTTYQVKEDDTLSGIAKLFGVRKNIIVNPNMKIGSNLKLTLNSKCVNYSIKENDTIDTIADNYNIDINNIHIPNDYFKQGEVINIVINDMGTTNTAHYFNYLGIKPRKSNSWTAAMIRNILTSPSVYGYLTWNKRKTVKILQNGQIIKRKPYSNDYILVRGKHKPILDEQTKVRIEEKLKSNRSKCISSEKEIKNPLVGLIKCGYCGNSMHRRPYYEKKDKKNRKKRCYPVDKTKLRIILRENKGNYSLNDIAHSLHVSKSIVDHWFSSNNQKFTIPHANKWYELKKLLNIKTDEFDKAITTFKEVPENVHKDTLICSKLRCECVSSDLDLVEKKILESLAELEIDYKYYINNYEKEIKKQIDTNKDLLDIINSKIDKCKMQIEKACELVENGTYTKELFINRTNTLNLELDKLKDKKNQIIKNKDVDKELKSKKKIVPIIELILKQYSDELTPGEKNRLLNLVIEKIIYKKDKGGKDNKNNFSLDIILHDFD